MPETKNNTILNIKISDIDIDDFTYKISSDIDITAMSDSIKSIGLINPPVVRQCNDGRYIVVSGFRRIKAVISNNISRINVRILSGIYRRTLSGEKFINNCVHDRDAAFIAVAENAFQRPLNQVEQARGVVLLKKVMEQNEIAEKSAAIFNFRMNPFFVEKLFLLGTMSDKITSLIESGNLSMTAALRLKQYNSDTVDGFINIFGAVKLGANKQMEIITNIHEIAALENKTPLDLIESDDVKDIIGNKNYDRQRKGSALRSFFAKRRYPRIKEAEEQFKINLKQLKLGNELNLRPPLNFESMNYIFSFKFRNYDELESRIKKLEHVSCNPVLRQMIS